MLSQILCYRCDLVQRLAFVATKMLIPANKILRETCLASYHLRHNRPTLYIHTCTHATNKRGAWHRAKWHERPKCCRDRYHAFELSRSRETRTNLISYVSNSFVRHENMRAFDNGINLCHSDSNVSHFQLPAHSPTIVINCYVENLQSSRNYSTLYRRQFSKLSKYEYHDQ